MTLEHFSQADLSDFARFFERNRLDVGVDARVAILAVKAFLDVFQTFGHEWCHVASRRRMSQPEESHQEETS